MDRVGQLHAPPILRFAGFAREAVSYTHLDVYKRQVDGLVRIADHRQSWVGLMMLNELRDELDLGRVHVLIFIDDHMLELLR